MHDVNSDETGMWARFGSSGNRFSIRIVSKRAFPLVVFGKSFRIFVRQGSQPPPKRAGRRMGTQPLPPGSSGDFPPDMKIVVGNEDRNLSRRRYRRIVGRSLYPEDDRNAGNQSGVGDHIFRARASAPIRTGPSSRRRSNCCCARPCRPLRERISGRGSSSS